MSRKWAGMSRIFFPARHFKRPLGRKVIDHQPKVNDAIDRQYWKQHAQFRKCFFNIHKDIFTSVRRVLQHLFFKKFPPLLGIYISLGRCNTRNNLQSTGYSPVCSDLEHAFNPRSIGSVENVRLFVSLLNSTLFSLPDTSLRILPSK